LYYFALHYFAFLAFLKFTKRDVCAHSTKPLSIPEKQGDPYRTLANFCTHGDHPLFRASFLDLRQGSRVFRTGHELDKDFAASRN
jgi:hypothetical protein